MLHFGTQLIVLSILQAAFLYKSFSVLTVCVCIFLQKEIVEKAAC